MDSKTKVQKTVKNYEGQREFELLHNTGELILF